MHIDPIAIQIGPLAIHWYGLAYVVGILCSWKITQYCVRQFWEISTTPWDTSINPIVLGILVGGRLGHVVFFEPHYFMNHPLEIFMIWHGGMSFHGGLLGVILAMLWQAHRYRINFGTFADATACGVPWALFFGRIANWVNGELYGRVTNVSWGQIFPYGGPLPRHPSQLYEAALEGVLLGIIMLFAVRKWHAYLGSLSGLFLVGYGVFRASVECVREIDWAWGGLTAGQWLCLPMIAGGLWLIFTKRS